MLITQKEVDEFSRKNNYPKFSEFKNRDKINEAFIFSETEHYDIFISHSYQDKAKIIELLQYLESKYKFHYKYYIDWIEDKELNRNEVNSETANKLKHRMKNCDSLLYITSENHCSSKWMPWELGYFDGLKNKVAILPIVSEKHTNESYNGQEYLGLYPNISVSKIMEPTPGIIYVNNKDQNNQIYFWEWLDNSDPFNIDIITF